MIVIPASSFKECLQVLTRVDSLPDRQGLSQARFSPSTQQGKIIADALTHLGLMASQHVVDKRHVLVALTETEDHKIASNIPDSEAASKILESQAFVLRSISSSLLQVEPVVADPKRVRSTLKRLVSNNQKKARSAEAGRVRDDLGDLDPNNASHKAIEDALVACVNDSDPQSRKTRVATLYREHGLTIIELANQQSTFELAVSKIDSLNAGTEL